MAISESRLLGPYNPVKDFQSGQTVLVLGELGVQEDLQAEIIESNLKQTHPFVFFLGKVKWVPRPFSSWEICEIAVKDRIVVARSLAVAVLCLLGAYLCKWSLSSVGNYYKKYTEGAFIRIYYRGIPHPPRPLRLDDIAAWGIELTIINLAYAALCALPIWSIANLLQERLYSEPEHSVATRKVKKAPASGASLSHDVMDAFSKQQLPLAEAQQPRNLTIGTHTANLWVMINTILSRYIPGSYPHPIEDRPMTSEESMKLCKDLKNILGIDWENFYSNTSQERCKQHFLSCLPQSIVQKYNLKEVFKNK